MYHFDLPYGKGSLPLELPKSRVNGVLVSGLDHYTPELSPQELVDRALENPIGSSPLWELCQGKENITIICSDHTRPVPSKLIIPPMLRQIRKGNPNAKVILLIATGCHRLTTREELVDKFGDKPDAMMQAGVAYAVDQIIDLIASGVSGIHIYTMNKPHIAAKIMESLQDVTK